MDCSSWLTPREDKVHAKGKGLMQTYWVLVPEESRTRLSSSNGSSTHGGDSTRAEDDPESIIAMVRSLSSNSNGAGAEHRASSIASMPTLNEE